MQAFLGYHRVQSGDKKMQERQTWGFTSVLTSLQHRVRPEHLISGVVCNAHSQRPKQHNKAPHLQPWAWLHNPGANPQCKQEQRQPSSQHSQEPSTAFGSEAKNWAGTWSSTPPSPHCTICTRPRPLWALPHKLPCLAARLPSSCCKKALSTVLWKVLLNLYQAKEHALYYSPIIFSWQTCRLGYRKWWKIGRQILLSGHTFFYHMLRFLDKGGFQTEKRNQYTDYLVYCPYYSSPRPT